MRRHFAAPSFHRRSAPLATLHHDISPPSDVVDILTTLDSFLQVRIQPRLHRKRARRVDIWRPPQRMNHELAHLPTVCFHHDFPSQYLSHIVLPFLPDNPSSQEPPFDLFTTLAHAGNRCFCSFVAPHIQLDCIRLVQDLLLLTHWKVESAIHSSRRKHAGDVGATILARTTRQR